MERLMVAKKAAEKEPVEEDREQTPEEHARDLMGLVASGDLKIPTPDGYSWRLIRGDHCLAQHCPMQLDDPLAYSKSPGF